MDAIETNPKLEQLIDLVCLTFIHLLLLPLLLLLLLLLPSSHTLVGLMNGDST